MTISPKIIFFAAIVAIAAGGIIFSRNYLLPQARGAQSYFVNCTPSNVEIGKTSQCTTNFPNPVWSVYIEGNINQNGTYTASPFFPLDQGPWPVTVVITNSPKPSVDTTIYVDYTTNINFDCTPSTINYTQTSQCASDISEDGYSEPRGFEGSVFPMSLVPPSKGSLVYGGGRPPASGFYTYIPPGGPFSGSVQATVEGTFCGILGRCFSVGTRTITVNGSTGTGGGGGGISVSITPQNAVVPINQTEQYTATVTGSPNTAVSWSVYCTGTFTSPCGSINQGGLFTAPPQNPYGQTGDVGDMIVYAASQADTSKIASSHVTVPGQGGGGGGGSYDCVSNSCVAGTKYPNLPSCQEACGVGGGLPDSISVSSTNSITGQPIKASWTFVYPNPNTNPCSPYIGACSNISQETYIMPPPSNSGDMYTIQPSSANDVSGPYVLKTATRNGQIAVRTTGILENIFSFFNDIFTKIARAVNVFPTASQTLSQHGNIHFLVAWDPVAKMTIAPTNLTFTNTSGPQTITITDTGAPGSNIIWTSSIGYTSGQPGGWLSLSSTAGTATWNTPANLTATINAANLPNGTYTALLSFSGISIPGSQGPLAGWIPVTLKVSGVSIPPAVSCSSFTANPKLIVPPESSVLAWQCVNVLPGGCSVDNVFGQFNGVGSTTVNPSNTTTYTLTCNGNGLGNTTTSNATVSVGGSGIHEIQP